MALVVVTLNPTELGDYLVRQNGLVHQHFFLQAKFLQKKTGAQGRDVELIAHQDIQRRYLAPGKRLVMPKSRFKLLTVNVLLVRRRNGNAACIFRVRIPGTITPLLEIHLSVPGLPGRGMNHRVYPLVVKPERVVAL